MSRETTLCYIFRGEDCLLLHRNKKIGDMNQEKWLGVGGKLEEGEDHRACVLREAFEETGLTLETFAYRGKIGFQSDQWGGEVMHLYTATEFSGRLREDCPEGTLVWRPFSDLFHLPRWAGDDLFLRQLQRSEAFFTLDLQYQGEELVEAVLDGQSLDLSKEDVWQT